MSPVRILVADPLPMFRIAVRTVLEREPDFAVVEAADLDATERLADGDGFEVALVDAGLPPAGGAEAARRIRAAGRARAVVWSPRPTREAVVDAVMAGADTYLNKDVSPEELVRVLRGVLAGEAPLGTEIAALLVDGVRTLADRSRARDLAAALSEREREVLDLVRHGAANREIAVQLAISEYTVKRHVQNILRKLEVPTRHAAAAFYASVIGPAAREEQPA